MILTPALPERLQGARLRGDDVRLVHGEEDRAAGHLRKRVE